MEVLEAVTRCGDEHLRHKVDRAVAIIHRTLDLYDPACVAFSFNGGKDSTVLLHLVRAAVAQRDPGAAGLGGIRTFFFHSDADFPEITAFTHATGERYGLDTAVLHGDFKPGLVAFLEESGTRAILLGTRRGDPNAPGQETFCPSSPGWPPFMRVNPILEWTYHDVWEFLRGAGLSYCPLYDRGYTSVGSVANTRPNAALSREDGTFAPAHALHDARLERAGRGAAGAGAALERGVSFRAAAGTAGLVIIGDEILSAKVDDVNMKFLAGELRAAGWRVERAVFVRDDVTAIAAAVRDLSEACDAVVTAGGVGPTPDDVTMAGVAEAMGRGVGRHPELEARIRRFFGADATEAHLKMAEAPAGAEVELLEWSGADGRPSPFPLVRCRNVYVLPGVPSLVQQKWRAVAEDLRRRGGEGGGDPAPFRSVVLRLRLGDETAVAAALAGAGAAGGGAVAVGSYPVSGQSDGCELVLTLEGKEEGALGAARAALLAGLPLGAVASEHRDADDAVNSPVEAPTVGPGVGVGDTAVGAADV